MQAHLGGRQAVSKGAEINTQGNGVSALKRITPGAMAEAEVLRELEGGICFIWGGQGGHLWGERQEAANHVKI